MIDSEINVPIDVTENCSIPMKKRTVEYKFCLLYHNGN